MHIRRAGKFRGLIKAGVSNPGPGDQKILVVLLVPLCQPLETSKTCRVVVLQNQKWTPLG